MTTPLGKKKEFLAFVSDEESQQIVLGFVTNRGLPEDSVQKGTIRDAIAVLKQERTPHVLLVDIENEEDALNDLNALADVCEPGVKVIITSFVNSFSFFKKLQEVGVEYYLLKPIKRDDLAAAVDAKKTVAQEAKTEAGKECHVYTFAGARGGVGTTTLAVNFAHILAHRLRLKTAVLDPDVHFGSAALSLDVEPSRGLREAIEKPDRVDSLFVDRVMVRHSDGFNVLSGEEGFEKNFAPHEAAVDTMLGELKKTQDAVVIDLPRIMNDYTRQMLQESSRIIMVTDLTIAGLRDCMRYADLLKKMDKMKDFMVVANRVGMVKKNEMPIKSFEKNLGYEIEYKFPFEPDIFSLTNAGKLAAEQGEQLQTVSMLLQLAQRCHAIEEAEVAEKKGKLLNRLFKK